MFSEGLILTPKKIKYVYSETPFTEWDSFQKNFVLSI